jgi:hypothetical protein
MGCPTSSEIGDAVTLTFSVMTHDPDTGILTDADAVPSYRIYENETATPIATGDMAKLDDGNTTGFYTEDITISAANGYEHGKTYTIYIVATVDGDQGGISYAFKAINPTPTATENADALLNRDMSAVSDTTARSPLNALRFLRNKWTLSGTTLSVKKEDDSAEAWNATVTTNAAAEPVTGSDPA